MADSIPVWMDKPELHAGRDWDSQLAQAIQTCKAMLFLMTPDSIDDLCTCKQEYSFALSYKKPIVPLLCQRGVQLPFRLQPRQYIDFTGDFKSALAKLRLHLQWLDSPDGELHALQDRLADANRDLRRATDATDRARIEDDIAQLKKQIAEQEKIVADPAAAAKRTEQSIERAIERERAPEKPISGKSKTKFINQPPGIAPSYFQDRYEENKIIGKFLRDEACRMMTVVGRAGIGKTAMVCRLLKSLESGRLPEDQGELPVDGIVYLSAVGTRVVNVPNLFADLCQLLPDEKSRDLDTLYKNPQVSIEAKINALLVEFPNGRFIILLDNFENVLDAETMNIRDAELDEALRALLNAPHHAVKVILTTRIAPHDLGFVQPGRQNRLNLDNGLEPQYAKNVLTENDADGTLGLKNASDDLLARACEFTRGFPRALEALIAILRADRYTTLAEILANAIPPDKVVEALVGEAFNRLDPNAQRVMQALAVYNRPVTPAAVDYLLQPFAASVDSAPVLNRLVTMQFVRRESGRYYLHPTDRAYAFSKLPATLTPALSLKGRGSTRSPLPRRERVRVRVRVDFSQHDLTTRAADYFAQTRKPRETWKTFTDLEPQLNEFDLRCAAEDYDTAASVLLEIDAEYLLLWGHYRLMIEMHERLQGKTNDQMLKQFSLNRLGSAMAMVGNVQKAIVFQEQALSIARKRGDHQNEGVYLGNLGNRLSVLGNTRRAIQFYEQALAVFREVGDKRGEESDLGNLGSAYSGLGETRHAITYYDQALAIAREIGNKQSEGTHLGNKAECLIYLGKYAEAIELAEQCAKISEEIGESDNYYFGWMALGHFYAGNLAAARSAAETARKYDVPQNNHNVAALLGIIALRQYGRGAVIAPTIAPNTGDKTSPLQDAIAAFTSAIEHADKILALTPELYDALDAKGIALCGLALAGAHPERSRVAAESKDAPLNDAIAAFRTARKINKDKGIVNRVLRLLDALALAHPNGAELLAEARAVVSG